jgi:hypothetical protein
MAANWINTEKTTRAGSEKPYKMLIKALPANQASLYPVA